MYTSNVSYAGHAGDAHMKNSKHNLIGHWTGASQDASGVLRAASDRLMAAVSLQDMVNI